MSPCGEWANAHLLMLMKAKTDQRFISRYGSTSQFNHFYKVTPCHVWSTSAYRSQHNTAPRYKQRRLPAASMLVVVGQARCSSHRTRDHRLPCIQFNCSSCVEQFTNGSAVFWVTGHFLTPPENWTVRAFLQLTLRLSNDFTAAWLTFTFPQLFAVSATLKSIDYNVAMTFILNNNNL